jgi:hypothetical protein
MCGLCAIPRRHTRYFAKKVARNGRVEETDLIWLFGLELTVTLSRQIVVAMAHGKARRDPL